MNELLFKNAAEKIRREMKSPNLNEPAVQIQDKIAEALEIFYKQDKSLAEAIIKSDKTFSDCCKQIVSDTKDAKYISDFNAYQRAVRFYLPDADIEFSMNIKTKKNISKISLLDLMKV